MDLPLELRNKILRYAFVELEPIVLGFSVNFKQGRMQWTPNELMQEPGLLKPCRQLRSEGLPVFYGANKFHCTTRVHFRLWLRWLGEEKRNLVKCLTGFAFGKTCYSECTRALRVLLDVHADFEYWQVPVAKGVFRVHVKDADASAWLNETEIRERLTVAEQNEAEEHWLHKTRPARLKALAAGDQDLLSYPILSA